MCDFANLFVSVGAVFRVFRERLSFVHVILFAPIAFCDGVVSEVDNTSRMTRTIYWTLMWDIGAEKENISGVRRDCDPHHRSGGFGGNAALFVKCDEPFLMPTRCEIETTTFRCRCIYRNQTGDMVVNKLVSRCILMCSVTAAARIFVVDFLFYRGLPVPPSTQRQHLTLCRASQSLSYRCDKAQNFLSAIAAARRV